MTSSDIIYLVYTTGEKLLCKKEKITVKINHFALDLLIFIDFDSVSLPQLCVPVGPCPRLPETVQDLSQLCATVLD